MSRTKFDECAAAPSRTVEKGSGWHVLDGTVRRSGDSSYAVPTGATTFARKRHQSLILCCEFLHTRSCGLHLKLHFSGSAAHLNALVSTLLPPSRPSTERFVIETGRQDTIHVLLHRHHLHHRCFIAGSAPTSFALSTLETVGKSITAARAVTTSFMLQISIVCCKGEDFLLISF